MDDLIQDELKQVIGAWAHGQRIHAIPLGHPVRVVKDANGQHEERNKFRQRRAYDYCFSLIAAGIESEKTTILTWQLFNMLVQTAAPKDLTAEERQAAESLAWKALIGGWSRAIAGFPEEHSIAITREADA
jgi:hypothetical protein